MSRRIYVLLGLSLAVVCIVALVRAQDASQRYSESASPYAGTVREADEPRTISGDDRDPTRRQTDMARRLRTIRDTRGTPAVVETSPVLTPTPAAQIAPSSSRYSDDNAVSPREGTGDSSRREGAAAPAQPQHAAEPRWPPSPPISAPPAVLPDSGGAGPVEPSPAANLPSVLKREPPAGNSRDAFVPPPPSRLPAATGRSASEPGARSALEQSPPPVVERNPYVLSEQSPSPVVERPRHVPAEQSPSPVVERNAPAVIEHVPHYVGDASIEDASSSRRTARDLRAYESSPAAPRSQALVSSQIPALRVETAGPQAVSIGKESAYTIKVVNEGDTPAENVTVTLRVPQWVEVAGLHADQGDARSASSGGEQNQIDWTISSVARRSEVSLSLRLIPRSDRPFELAVDVAARPSRSYARVEVKVPRLDIRLSGPSDVLHGEPCMYQVTLSNPGTGDAENVILRVHHDGSGGQSQGGTRIGTIAAGEQKQLQLEFLPGGAGTMQIHAEAAADGDLAAEARHDVFVRRAVLEVHAAGPPLAFAAAPVQYEIEVANTGTAPAENAELTVTLPKGTQYIGGIDGAKIVGGTLTLPLGNLPPQSRRTYQIQCTSSTPGDARLDVDVRASRNASASTSVVTRVEALAELKLDMEEPRGPQTVGADAVYVIHIKNRGTKAARQIQVVVQFSDGVEPVSAQGAKAELVPGQAMFQPLVNLGAGEEIALTVKARADQSGNHLFRTEVRCTEPETKLVFEGTTRFYGEVSGAAGETASKGGTLRR